MSDIKFAAGRGNNWKDYTELVKQVTLTGKKGTAPRSLQVVLLDSEQHDRAAINCGDGITCVFSADGKERFRGLIMTDDSGSSKTLTIKAYDECIYLANNKDSFSYKKKKASYIFKDCLKKLGLKLGSAVDTGYVIKELVKTRTTYWDVIQAALEETYKATGRRYYVYADKGKIYLKRRKEQSVIPVLELNTNTEDYSRSRSIYDSRTRIKLTTSKGKTKKSYTNKSLEAKIGRFQEIESVDEDATAAEMKEQINVQGPDVPREGVLRRGADRRHSGASHDHRGSLKWTGTGNWDIVAGGCVYVNIPVLSEKRVMYVDEDKHTWEKGRHSMKLTLNYAADIDKAG